MDRQADAYPNQVEAGSPKAPEAACRVVRWLKRALVNFEAEAEYIARASPAAARRVVAAIDRSVQYLACYPSVGRPGQLAGTRELVVPDTAYVISYPVHERRVEALRVFHGARKWPPKR